MCIYIYIYIYIYTRMVSDRPTQTNRISDCGREIGSRVRIKTEREIAKETEPGSRTGTGMEAEMQLDMETD